MTDEQRPLPNRPEDEDVEGHGFVPPRPVSDKAQTDEDDDVEGHGFVPPRPLDDKARTDEDDDVEAHVAGAPIPEPPIGG
jgi:hypothetical protein